MGKKGKENKDKNPKVTIMVDKHKLFSDISDNEIDTLCSNSNIATSSARSSSQVVIPGVNSNICRMSNTSVSSLVLCSLYMHIKIND